MKNIIRIRINGNESIICALRESSLSNYNIYTPNYMGVLLC